MHSTVLMSMPLISCISRYFIRDLNGQCKKRQRGTVHHPGLNVGMGKDHTIYALVDGVVVFTEGKNGRRFINIDPEVKA